MGVVQRGAGAAMSDVPWKFDNQYRDAYERERDWRIRAEAQVRYSNMTHWEFMRYMADLERRISRLRKCLRGETEAKIREAVDKYVAEIRWEESATSKEKRLLAAKERDKLLDLVTRAYKAGWADARGIAP